ncbi:MAG TPA: class I SAM-dependent methyltransferase [Thermoanaerobaculia bacterium]|nr:class I SAM-dependent methyltransferase [Thermoanaerobaculia bacterium]
MNPTSSAQTPHEVLPAYYGSAAERRPFVGRLFDDGAPYYEKINRWMSFGTGVFYRKEALQRAGLTAGMKVLDVATGTGVVARAALEVVGSTGRVIGLDPSAGMLREAGRIPDLRCVRGFAEALPVADQSVDFLSMGYALRHVADLAATFAEYRRVLRPGGRLLILEIFRPQNRFALAWVRFYLRRLIPWLAAVRSREARTMMEYFWDTIDACVPPEAILSALREVGFTDVRRVVQWGFLTEYQARRPE